MTDTTVHFRNSPLSHRRGVLVRCDVDGEPLAYGEALRRMREDAWFSAKLTATLADLPFAAFRWETPPVTAKCLDQPFEFVVIDSPGLADEADPSAFARHFEHAPDEPIVVFSSLGRDATLVVPRQIAAPNAYTHLAAFVHHAPPPQQRALWAAVGHAMARRIGEEPVWLSTAGAGVPWLHVRLDDRPKYYGYSAYTAPP